jgi:hypothetical protein
MQAVFSSDLALRLSLDETKDRENYKCRFPCDHRNSGVLFKSAGRLPPLRWGMNGSALSIFDIREKHKILWLIKSAVKPRPSGLGI